MLTLAIHFFGYGFGQPWGGWGPWLVLVAQVGSVAANIALGFGFFFLAFLGPHLGVPILIVGIVGLALMALFQLITLPVEFDASNRAKQILTSTGILLQGEETAAMYKT